MVEALKAQKAHPRRLPGNIVVPFLYTLRMYPYIRSDAIDMIVWTEFLVTPPAAPLIEMLGWKFSEIGLDGPVPDN
jgi:hypothetical protein